jgi:hypothetical protein
MTLTKYASLIVNRISRYRLALLGWLYPIAFLAFLFPWSNDSVFSMRLFWSIRRKEAALDVLFFAGIAHLVMLVKSYSDLNHQIDRAYDQAFDQEKMRNLPRGMRQLGLWISLSVGFFLVVISAMRGYSQESLMYQYNSGKEVIIDRASELSRGGGCGALVKQAFEEMEQDAASAKN